MGYFFVYFMTNKYNKVLYCGITNNLIRRVIEHKLHLIPKSFSSTYRVNKLVYYELFLSPRSAIDREKQIKNYSRKKKEELINSLNPNWSDLFNDDSYEITTSPLAPRNDITE